MLPEVHFDNSSQHRKAGDQMLLDGVIATLERYCHLLFELWEECSRQGRIVLPFAREDEKEGVWSAWSLPLPKAMHTHLHVLGNKNERTMGPPMMMLLRGRTKTMTVVSVSRVPMVHGSGVNPRTTQ